MLTGMEAPPPAPVLPAGTEQVAERAEGSGDLTSCSWGTFITWGLNPSRTGGTLRVRDRGGDRELTLLALSPKTEASLVTQRRGTGICQQVATNAGDLCTRGERG